MALCLFPQLAGRHSLTLGCIHIYRLRLTPNLIDSDGDLDPIISERLTERKSLLITAEYIVDMSFFFGNHLYPSFGSPGHGSKSEIRGHCRRANMNHVRLWILFAFILWL